MESHQLKLLEEDFRHLSLDSMMEQLEHHQFQQTQANMSHLEGQESIFIRQILALRVEVILFGHSKRNLFRGMLLRVIRSLTSSSFRITLLIIILLISVWKVDGFRLKQHNYCRISLR